MTVDSVYYDQQNHTMDDTIIEGNSESYIFF